MHSPQTAKFTRCFRLLCALFSALALFAGIIHAQLTTGLLEGGLRTGLGRALSGVLIIVSDAAGSETTVRTGSMGHFAFALAYGCYRVSVQVPNKQRIAGPEVFIAPLQTSHIDLVFEGGGKLALSGRPAKAALLGPWTDSTQGMVYAEGFALQSALGTRAPTIVTEPLDLTGLADNRLAVISPHGLPWTTTQFKFAGLDVTDSYQPGYPAILPDVQALNETMLRTGFALTTSGSYGTEIDLFPRQAAPAWHGSVSTSNTGSGLASGNLPQAAERGLLRQSEKFNWFTRDRMEAGGPLTRTADLFVSGAGQWSSQTLPLEPPGTQQISRFAYGNARSRIHVGPRDQIDLAYSGSRLNLSNGGEPAGIEALTGRRGSPELTLPNGFPQEAESDTFQLLQAGWTHQFAGNPRAGVLEVRYGITTAHLNTWQASQSVPDQSRIELFGSEVTGAPPLENLSVRPRQEFAVAWQPGLLQAGGTRHQITGGGSWTNSSPENRFRAPSDLNLITANGQPAFVLELNTPADSRETIRSFTGYLADHVEIAGTLSLDIGGFLDLARGSLPAQSSSAGAFTPARTFDAMPDLIVWNSVSPRAGFAWQVPHAPWFVIRGMYTRLYSPLAGRYLDFGNPNGLGGSEYQWIDHNGDGWFEAVEQGTLLLRFGSPYSSISQSLKRPYADQLDLGGEFRLMRQSAAAIHLFRRDDKNRIAAIDTGVPAQAFTPTSVLDPGPDGIFGTFDDQLLSVYQQNPATLGQDRYLLTNPSGLREFNEGVSAEVKTAWRNFTIGASFAVEKSWGPSNPGDAYFENDPGIIGALFLDPNTNIHAAGDGFNDRGFVGNCQALYRFPSKWGGLEIASVIDYIDGLVFARQLLVTGLAQGPILIPTTVRGSPEGGNRAQYVLNWNLRLGKELTLPRGRLTALVEALNVSNTNNKIQESDLSWSAFNLRLPIAIQPPRFVRFELRYEF
jgi:hypothetical protein